MKNRAELLVRILLDQPPLPERQTDAGKLMGRYKGGRHRGAGTCRLPLPDADAKLREIIETIENDAGSRRRS